MSEKMKGRVISDEWRQKISLALKGKKRWSDEDKLRMSEQRKGRIPTADTIRKRAETRAKNKALKQLSSASNEPIN